MFRGPYIDCDHVQCRVCFGTLRPSARFLLRPLEVSHSQHCFNCGNVKVLSIFSTCLRTVADPGFTNGGQGRGAAGAEGSGVLGELSPPHWGGVWGRGDDLSPEKRNRFWISKWRL